MGHITSQIMGHITPEGGLGASPQGFERGASPFAIPAGWG